MSSAAYVYVFSNPPIYVLLIIVVLVVVVLFTIGTLKLMYTYF